MHMLGVTLPVFSHKLRCILGFGLVEMAIWTNPKPTLYRNLYENLGSGDPGGPRSARAAATQEQ